MTGANAKIKRIMIGDKQVRPEILYEYSYDFRNKSVANLNADGIYFTDNNGVTGTANGITATEYSKGYLNTNLSSYISRAKTITLIAKGQLGYIGLWIGNNTARNNLTGEYTQANQMAQNVYGSSAGYTISAPSGTVFTETFVVDLENKNWKLTHSVGATQTGILTDTQVNNIRSNNKYLLFNLSYTGYFTSMQLIIK